MVRTIPAPNGRHTAILFERDCGATTDFSTQIAIVDSGAKQQESDRVFIADSNRGRAPINADDVLSVDIIWNPDSTLTIAYPSQAHVFLKAPDHLGIRIVYQEK